MLAGYLPSEQGKRSYSPIMKNYTSDAQFQHAGDNGTSKTAPIRVIAQVRAFAVTTALVSLLQIGIAARAMAGQEAIRTSEGSHLNLERAINLSAAYLMKECRPNGEFAYKVDTESGQVSRSYNILRHAGAIYALATFNRYHPDTQIVDVMARAGHFMRENYIGQDDPHSRTLVVWSRPAIAASEAELGGAGLGLVALTSVAHARPGVVLLEDLQFLGRFVVSMQKADGSFFSKYRRGFGPITVRQSLYYPGEAALGLIGLYEIDHSRQWLDAAGRALSYLAKSRRGIDELPADHWALIATAKFLSYSEEAKSSASRADLIRHANDVSKAILLEQIKSADHPKLIGGFAVDGRTTPTATRLEGLLSVLEFLPPEATELRSQIEAAVKLGVAFLLRSQIISGPFAGGVPGATPGLWSPVMKAESRGSTVRIDYVQHALCAWLQYENLYLHAGRARPSK
jgi:hypothetical protein